jgi:SAM-dependent methyltransferase
MAQAMNFPIFLPADARRAFGSEDSVRRLARVSSWGARSKVLELASGPGACSLVLASEIGCAVTVADDDPAALERVKERAKGLGIAEKVETKRVDLQKPSFGDGEFDGIVALGRVVMSLDEAVKSLRRYLAPKGRLCLTYPVRVGRHPASVVIEHWEKRLGEALLLPRDCLQLLEKAGYEPEAVETLSSVELDEYYRALEPHVAIDEPAKAIREEMDLHRTAGGRGSFSYGLVIGRRKEPGEKPPISRNE